MPRVLILLIALAAGLALLFVVADAAEATHYRYGTLSWESTENENEVRFTGAQAWRTTFWYSSPPPVGTIHTVDSVATGDGGSIPMRLEIVQVNEHHDWFFGVMVDEDGNPGIPYTYSAPNDEGEPWEVRWSVCCRISPYASGNHHVNNPDHVPVLESLVDLEISQGTPKTNVPPIVPCELDTVCEIPIQHIGGQNVSYRMSTASEMGDSRSVPPGPPHAPNPALVDPVEGIISWNTTDASHDPDWENWQTLYSIQVMLEDGPTKVPVDFFIRLIPEGSVPPQWDNPQPVCGTTMVVNALTTMSFDVRAYSEDPETNVRLDHLGLPSGASFPLPDPDNPVTGTFSWTPSRDQVGEHLIVFTAEDDIGLQSSPCPVTIKVEEGPYWTNPELECGATTDALVGRAFEAEISAQSDNGSRLIHIGHEGLPTGASFPVPDPANPVSGVFAWTPGMEDRGLHTVVFTAVDDHGQEAEDCVVSLDVRLPDPRGQAMVRALWAGTAVPMSFEYTTEAIDQRGQGSGRNLHVTVDQPEYGLWAHGVEEEASVEYDLDNATVTTTAYLKAAEIELFDGLVVIEGLEQETSLVWDLVERNHTLESRTFLTNLHVAGEEVPVDLDGGSVDIPLPGGGTLLLFERDEEVEADRVIYRETLAHAYLPVGSDPLSYSRHELIFGSHLLQAGGAPPEFPYLSQERLILSQDDAGSGENAGDNPDDALPIGPGLYHGSTPPGDRVDYYEIDLEHGEKIQLAVQPAARAKLAGGGLHLDEGNLLEPDLEVPDSHVSSLERYDLRLFDPTGTERERSNLALAGVPQRIELNADLDGAWHVRVERMPQVQEAEAYNYTLGVSVTPVPLLPDEPMFNGADACGAPDAPELLQGVHPKTMQHDDFIDVYRFSADIGDLITVTMKPGETLDGWDAALTLYDEGCQIITRLDSPLLGDLGYSYKGAPRVIAELPSLYTGDYYVEVERLNGIGNYYLGLTVTDPFPQVPLLWDDQDPPENHQDADEAPPVFFQGDLHDDNPGDAYLLPFEEGKQASVVVKMSAMSTVDVKLYRPDGTSLVPQSENLLGGQFVRYHFEATQTGEYGLEIRPTHGGGTYGVAWGQSPVENQDPEDLPLP